MSLRLTLCVGAFMGFRNCSALAINKWVDENGRIHFVDKVPAEYRESATAVDLKSINTVSVGGAPEGLSQSGKVMLYSTVWCLHCQRAKAYFSTNGISYTERDIEKSTSARREYKKLGGKGVPLILIGDQMMRGFSAKRVQTLYEEESG